MSPFPFTNNTAANTHSHSTPLEGCSRKHSALLSTSTTLPMSRLRSHACEPHGQYDASLDGPALTLQPATMRVQQQLVHHPKAQASSCSSTTHPRFERSFTKSGTSEGLAEPGGLPCLAATELPEGPAGALQPPAGAPAPACMPGLGQGLGTHLVCCRASTLPPKIDPAGSSACATACTYLPRTRSTAAVSTCIVFVKRARTWSVNPHVLPHMSCHTKASRLAGRGAGREAGREAGRDAGRRAGRRAGGEAGRGAHRSSHSLWGAGREEH